MAVLERLRDFADQGLNLDGHHLIQTISLFSVCIGHFKAGVEEFFNEFGRFFCEDSRHDLWVRSHDDDATIVLDRHNVIYAYGPLVAFEAALQSLGARKGEPAVLGAHLHHYHPAWDEAERRVLRSFDWDIKPLRPSDVQFDATRDDRQ